jgi:hypothetical protein
MNSLPNKIVSVQTTRNNFFFGLFAGGTLILCNVVTGTPDTKMDGSCLKLKEVGNEIQFITHTLNVKHGPGAFYIYNEYQDKYETHVFSPTVFLDLMFRSAENPKSHKYDVEN